MRKLKTGLLATLLAAGVCLFSGCGQVDESFLENNTDLSVNIMVPYSTTTPLPEYLNVPDQVVIDANGGVTVNDSSLLNNSYTSAKQDESKYATLNLGKTGEEVQALQQRLQALGYYAEGVSGVYDDATETAVKRFEQTYGIMQTGIATPAFQVKLFAEDAPVYGSEAYNTAVVSQYSTLQRGAVGSAVYALQHRLKELGYPISELSGVYDENTEQAVRLFGRAYGLENQTVAYIALQQELYSDSAIPYTTGQNAPSSVSLGVGNMGTKVMRIQNRLIELGYMEGAATGVYDTVTEAAVRAFEEACNVTPSGQLNSALQTLLMSAEAPIYGTKYATEIRTYIDLAEGDQGDQVTALQERLVELGYATGSANGVYGAQTTTAMRMFQQYNGLEPTGRASAFDQEDLYALSALSYQDIQNGLTFVMPTPVPTVEPTRDPETIANMGGLNTGEDVDPDTGMRTLRAGSRGDDVTVLQNRLNRLGYTCNVDGNFTEETAEALKTFQSHVGVSQTGFATPALQTYIQTNAAPAIQYRMYTATQPFATLRQGDEGDAVTRLQQQLWKLGHLLTDDVKDSVGVFHDKTRAAVISAQRAMGYKNPDGIATEEFQCFVFSEYNYFIKR